MGDTWRCLSWWEGSSREEEIDLVGKKSNSRDRFLYKAKVNRLTFDYRKEKEKDTADTSSLYVCLVVGRWGCC